MLIQHHETGVSPADVPQNRLAVLAINTTLTVINLHVCVHNQEIFDLKGAFTRRNIRCNMLFNMLRRMLHRTLCNKSPPLTRTELYANLLLATRNNLEQILFC